MPVRSTAFFASIDDMANTVRNLKTIEFGDFQTPIKLARQISRRLGLMGVRPASLLEPTCGIGHLLTAALDEFPEVGMALGIEISPPYVDRLNASISERADAHKVRLVLGDFFEADWPTLLRGLPDPLLVIGNPPWVTNSQLGAIGGKNLPTKTNIRGLNGLDALTGKSNFDVSESMILRLLRNLDGRDATLAMLCKTAVARRVLEASWKVGRRIVDARIHRIDAAAHFDAAVDACLLVCAFGREAGPPTCAVYAQLDDEAPASSIGLRDGQLIADLAAHDQWGHLAGPEVLRWRSGIKHDCAAVMELRRVGARYQNGHGDLVELEDRYLYPMLKSSELANGRVNAPARWMLVTQTTIAGDTPAIEAVAPKTWDYLQKHAEALDGRASSIYKNRPRFSVFGVGPYSFAPWKVAISGFYKRLQFAAVGPCEGRPVVLDDTAYFLACSSQADAVFLTDLLNSEPARGFYSASTFWDAKRPITIDLLRKLDLRALARAAGSESRLDALLGQARSDREVAGPSLFD